VVILALFLISVSLFVVFTFRMPWHDVFADPLPRLFLGGSTGV
jgi:hypothetical protein